MEDRLDQGGDDLRIRISEWLHLVEPIIKVIPLCSQQGGSVSHIRSLAMQSKGREGC